jgi:hypothetical protein
MSDYAEIIQAIMDRIPDDLGRRPGKVLYSGTATVKPGRLYLLGVNPGGSPEAEPQTIYDHPRSLRSWAMNTWMLSGLQGDDPVRRVWLRSSSESPSC